MARLTREQRISSRMRRHLHRSLFTFAKWAIKYHEGKEASVQEVWNFIDEFIER